MFRVRLPDPPYNPTGPEPSRDCGDGRLSGLEDCDDTNQSGGDGCSANCSNVEPGFLCPVAGHPCVPVAVCGDGILTPTEQCDDRNRSSDDGCSDVCTFEHGYKCDVPGQPCKATVCGDGKREGAEDCDDGNQFSFDGCSEDCRTEPRCDSDSCVTACGDGILGEGASGNEECDDGNTKDLDGCSGDCKFEPGFTCQAVLVTSCNEYSGCSAWQQVTTLKSWSISRCKPVCGDCIVAGGEMCDDGVNTGGYNLCGPGCVLGEYCGDGIENGTEECDFGWAGPWCIGCHKQPLVF